MPMPGAQTNPPDRSGGFLIPTPRLAPPLLLVAVLQRGAEDVAERSAGVGRAVLGHRLLLFGDLQRLDRDLHLARLLVVGDDARVDLLADREAFRTLLVAVARQVGA